MRNHEDGSCFIGFAFVINIDGHRVGTEEGAAARALEFYKRQLGVYAPMLEVGSPLHLDICWECRLKSMGVKAPNQEEGA